MNKEHIKHTINQHIAELKQLGVKQLLLFGPFAKECANADSNIDFIVTMDDISYNKLAKLHSILEGLLHRKVDLLRKGPHLNPDFLNTLESEIIYG